MDQLREGRSLITKSRRNKPRGILFFDIDGGLNTSYDWRRKPYIFRENIVKIMSELAIEENLSLVMTSSWRNGFYGPGNEENLPHIKALESSFDRYGVKIEGATPMLKGRSRDDEIERYLYYHPCDRYVIVDDDPSEYKQTGPKNIFTCSERGFDADTIFGIKKALGIHK